MLMGGANSGITSEIVKIDGTTERSFDLKYDTGYETFQWMHLLLYFHLCQESLLHPRPLVRHGAGDRRRGHSENRVEVQSARLGGGPAPAQCGEILPRLWRLCVQWRHGELSISCVANDPLNFSIQKQHDNS